MHVSPLSNTPPLLSELEDQDDDHHEDEFEDKCWSEIKREYLS
jgi:hypothetical protein